MQAPHKFESRKDGLFTSVFVGVSMLMLVVIGLALVENLNFVGLLIVVVSSFLVIGLLLWIYLGTYYEIPNDVLKYRSGPMRGSIAISRISKVTKGRTLWVGTKPALARKGLIISYERFNEIYISPEQEELFLEMLLEQNPSIKIIEAGGNPVY